MAKYLTVAQLTEINVKLRGRTEEITRRAARAREELERARDEAERRYSALPPRDRRQYVAREVSATNAGIVSSFDEDTRGALREVAALAADIEAARELYENPIKRLNVMTAMHPAMAARRAEVAAMLANAGPAEVETLADAFRSTRDLGGLAAVLSRNSQVPAAERRMTNASIVSGVEFPDAEQVAAVLRDAAELPAVAAQEARRVRNVGRLSGADRIRGGLRVVRVDREGSVSGGEHVSAD